MERPSRGALRRTRPKSAVRSRGCAIPRNLAFRLTTDSPGYGAGTNSVVHVSIEGGELCWTNDLRPERMAAIMRACRAWLRGPMLAQRVSDQQLEPDTHMKLGIRILGDDVESCGLGTYDEAVVRSALHDGRVSANRARPQPTPATLDSA